MLFRSKNGKYLEIIRLDFSSDEEYYKVVAKTKGFPLKVILDDPEERIMNAIQTNIVNIRKHTNTPNTNVNR